MIASAPWWRDAVIYQIYPRSFADSNGDGTGDLTGIRSRLSHLVNLGIDAVWMSPFYPSPGADGGYDVADYTDVDPCFGTLADIELLIEELHDADIQLIIDLVPNHCSVEHPLFQAALSSPPGSSERDLFHFRDGSGSEGGTPPNNWQSHFGGPAWTRLPDGQWYLHLFDSGQPDFNWDNSKVRSYFEDVLRFWLDRDVDGLRVDVAHLLIKDPQLPDWGGPANGAQHPDFPTEESPMFGLKGVHDVFRDWRRILDDYSSRTGRERMMCGEVCVEPLDWQATWAAPGEMQTVFNFALLNTPFEANAWREVIEQSLAAFDSVGAPTTWVLSNHDVVRHATRLAYPDGNPKIGDGIGPDDPQPDHQLGLERATAATGVILALPGSVYLYQGEELGLPDHTNLDHSFRLDPAYHRTTGDRIGRDGCRIPLPWDSEATTFGFSESDDTWLPQPEEFGPLSVNLQEDDPSSTLQLYRSMISWRKELGLGQANSDIDSLQASAEGVLSFRTSGVTVLMNTGDEPVDVSELTAGGAVLVETQSAALVDGMIRPRSTIWVR